MKALVTIYRISRVGTQDGYVGSSVQLSQRWAYHRTSLRKGVHHCRHLQRAWNKYGEDAFDFAILETAVCKTRQERFIAELAWIARAGTYNHLVPSERSGQFTVSSESRALRSALMLAKKAADPRYAAFVAARGAAMAAWMRSPEGRANMAKHTKRRWQDPIERAKLAQGLENRWANPSAREHMSVVTGARMRTEEAAQAHSERLKAAWQDPEKSVRLRKRLEFRWADPEARARQSEKLRAAWARRKAAAT